MDSKCDILKSKDEYRSMHDHRKQHSGCWDRDWLKKSCCHMVSDMDDGSEVESKILNKLFMEQHCYCLWVET